MTLQKMHIPIPQQDERRADFIQALARVIAVTRRDWRLAGHAPQPSIVVTAAQRCAAHAP